MKYLFVGGPRDGERIEIADDRPYYKFAVKCDLRRGLDMATEFCDVTYRRLSFCGHFFFACAMMSPDEAVGELIRRYPVEQKAWDA